MQAAVPARDSQSAPRVGALYYVLPFVVFIAMLALRPYTGLAPRMEFLLRAVLVGGAILFVAPKVTGWRVNRLWSSIALGIAVFAVWIGPDALIPGWRQSVIFQNSITGHMGSTIAPAFRSDSILILLRCLQAIVLVPIAEELFWRGWVLRWLVDKDFESVAIGAYTAAAFWITALLFGAEHGPMWEVGIAAGAAYNWWAGRSRSLGDCMLAHAVTNGALCAYILVANRWEYWS